MRLFLYEHVTGGGLLSAAERPDKIASLAAEGRSMVAALAADLAAVYGSDVTTLRDRRLPPCQLAPQNWVEVKVETAEQRDAAFDRLAANADWTIVLAPEIGGALEKRCRRVLEVGGHLLGGSLDTVLLASDKHATAQHLARSGVPVPHGMPFSLGQPWPVGFRYPAVWKPLDGAGSQGLTIIENDHALRPPTDPRPGRLEELCPRRLPYPDDGQATVPSGEQQIEAGVAASVAFLCGPAERLGLPPCRQRLAADFHYLGGSLPLETHLAERAASLARRVVQTLPDPLGYIGVDLVLLPDDEAGDVVIEINPRLTTSYVGLRVACRENLAEAMLAVAAGRPFNLSFGNAAVSWTAS